MFDDNEFYNPQNLISSNEDENDIHDTEIEKKMIGRKRQSTRIKKNINDLHNGDDDPSNLSDTGKSKFKNNQKRRLKKSNLDYVVPQRVIFKASEVLVSIINKVMTKFDYLNILRGFRNKIKDDANFNNFKSKKVEKLLFSDNPEVKVIADFNSNSILIEINKFPNKNTEISNSNLIFEDLRAVASEHKTKSNNEIDYSESILNLKMNSNFYLYILESEPDQCDKRNIVNNIENISLQTLPSNSFINLKDPELKLICKIFIKFLDSEYVKELEQKFKNKVISSKYVDNIDILKYKTENNYYNNIKDFENDVLAMFRSISNNLSQLIKPNNKDTINVAIEYLKSIYIEFIKLICAEQKNFKELLEKDIKSLIDGNKLPKINCLFKNEPVKKGYEVIEDYYHIFPEVTKEKTKTNLLPSCEGGCCGDFELLGPLNLEKSRWDSKCSDRHNNLECNPDICGCKNENCKNQSIRNKIFKQIGEDVLEKYTWGIDLFTHRNLIEFLPLNFTDEFKSENFIERTLIKSLSKLELEGYSLKKSCKYIIEKCIMSGSSDDEESLDLEKFNKDKKYKYLDYFFANHLLNVYKFSKLAVKHSSTSYCKGIGIFCQKDGGIRQNELITVYLGEIYPPWYWYEKQDLIKKNKLDNELPDFYNIMLERLKTDSNGYDIVMVDPNSKGNFASRMSHSCQPNCNTVLMCSNNQYVIGMFATKDIEIGDELTFDYNSVTEKEKEFQDAICLCSSFNCRGHYLIYSNSVLFSEVLSKYHTFLHRNIIILQACNPEFEKNKYQILIECDEILFKKYSIGSSILGKAPFWIKKWTALILRYVEFENNMLRKILSDKNLNAKPEYEINFQKRNSNFIDFPKEEKISNIEEYKKSINSNGKICYEDSNYSKNYKYSKKESTYRENIEVNLIDKKSNTLPSRNSHGILNKKYNFNNDNFYYPDKKTYFSSTRNKKIELENKKHENIYEIIKNDYNNNKFKVINHNVQGKINQLILDKQINGNGRRKTLDMNIPNEEEKIDLENYSDEIEIEIEAAKLIPISNNHNLDAVKLQLEMNKNLPIPDQENINHQVNGLIENRIQNIAISIDKVIHVLDLMKVSEPPLEILSEKEIIQFYWGKEDSLRFDLEKNILHLLKNNQFINYSSELREILNKITTILNFNREDLSNLQKIREKLLFISKNVKICGKLDVSNKYIFYDGLSDVLFLYASTKTYFKNNNKKYEKKNLTSEKICIRQRDINTNACVQDLDSIVCSGEKSYDKLYIWGQLSGWFKQTVDKPNASLSAERRGSLSYPDMDSFFADICLDKKLQSRKKESSKFIESIFQYPGSNRKNFYSKLTENPSMMWPVGNEWSYKNKNKIYGTVQFDSIYTAKNIYDLEESNSYLINILEKMEN